MSETGEEIKHPIPEGDVPAPVLAAGDAVVRAYREFLGDPKWSQATRRLYGQRIRRFLRWAESHGLTLKMIGVSALADYAGGIAARGHRLIVRPSPRPAMLSTASLLRSS